MQTLSFFPSYKNFNSHRSITHSSLIPILLNNTSPTHMQPHTHTPHSYTNTSKCSHFVYSIILYTISRARQISWRICLKSVSLCLKETSQHFVETGLQQWQRRPRPLLYQSTKWYRSLIIWSPPLLGDNQDNKGGPGRAVPVSFWVITSYFKPSRAVMI